ncbi:MAG: sialate O-acetylesterase [Gemmataceae bacterium]|nr:sialate O-acetylesterase [Gemmataceae bacterium]MCS7270352.1 sialate O-acetylesterase [Gemmataceae bacterium]MDW8242506.1 sialate O-acetylesterase [Thermogemmata sp.]
MSLSRLLTAVGCLWWVSLPSVRADVTPHPLFSDHMVFQQGMPLRVWGKAQPGEKVTVRLQREEQPPITAATNADDQGRWSVELPAQKAGTGWTLTIQGHNTLTFNNVAIGEVWICSGQSNMQWELWRLTKDDQGKKVAAQARHPHIRLFTVPRRPALTPQEDFPVQTVTRAKEYTVVFGRWQECTPETAYEFSAVAYFFGRDLEKALHVPIGLIATNWGGTVCEAWTSLEALDKVPSLKYLADRARQAQQNNPSDKKGLNPNIPTVLFNGMIHPLLKFPVRGAIWYQGESNAPRAFEYRTLYPTMIQDWRQRWGGDFPFLGVQLAPYWDGNSDGVRYAELRDAQLLATKILPKVGLAVITDAGDEKDIHPQQKEPVGARLALAARALAYGEKIVYSGPIFREARFEGKKAVLSFDHVGGGLVARDGPLTGFTACGTDRIFRPAKAVIEGDTVVVTCDDVDQIVAVRYGWVNFARPPLNLFNKEGLPASPFRTDDFPLTTQPKDKK